ncbi:hypothetical protein IF690_02180 [Pseudomonas sp. SK3(2021)]|uniref:hypothetical protein n=1 Tax=Pseudomonas sp. SK3(2021) TaxID=2841064 RepID=UPI00192A7300|nr:hypothetical protein [Pseudomonas sp. SK3(2021)]QQZ42368.1 hypothetical protein IF690_02180 [Pseudomonas sp. SK3(2021)]
MKKTYREFANIGLAPINSLENTVAVLGDILNINFIKDNEGIYEEYPAFLASTQTLRYVILGVPSPEEDLRDTPSNEFNLIVSSIDADPDLPEVDMSEQLIKTLIKHEAVKCWKLNQT